MKILTSLLAFCFFSSLCLSQTVNLTSFASGFSQPVEIANTGVPNDTRLFIVEKSGIIKILNSDGSINSTPFLDISTIVGSGGERGLLGLAFAQDYITSGKFYVNYTDNSSTSEPNTAIARYTVSTNPELANSTGTVLLTYQQPFNNHNGGKLDFGPDNYLYIASGDGGSGGDPGDRAQNTTTLLGKLLRIDVSGTNYTIPSSNPFATSANGPDDPRPEIYAIGLRNPWKFSFDKNNGDLWIADVGQKGFEEINLISITNGPINNFGWRCFEGIDHVFNTTGNCNSVDFNDTTSPVAEYSHVGAGCTGSITGGYLYRGLTYGSFTGKYFFADYCSKEIGILSDTGSGWSMAFQTPNITQSWTTFGEDINGELYVAGGSTVYKIEGNNLSTFEVNVLEFKLFPNPTKNDLNIDLTKKFEDIKAIRISNIQGQLIKVIENPTQQIIKIQTENYTSGLYFIEVKANNNSKAFKKLIIN